MPIGTSKVETLRWRAGRLEMIDQRVLPDTLTYVSCQRAAEVAGAIRSMVVRGAPAIGCAAAYGVALEAHALRNAAKPAFVAGLERGLNELAGSRPTAVNLSWAVDRMLGVWRSVESESPPAIADENDPNRFRLSQPWFLFDAYAELRAIMRMYVDPRYRLPWPAKVIPLVLLLLILSSRLWVPGGMFLPELIFSVLDKIVDLILAFVAFKLLGREARRYRQTSPDLPPMMRL